MKEKLKDARKDILTLTQLSILAALFISVWIVQNMFPIKTLAAMVAIAISLFLLIAFLFLLGAKKGEKYSPIFPPPLDIIMLILAITAFSYVSLLIALQFTDSDDNAEFIFKSVLFGLSFLGFWCYRSTEKKQYLLYAIIYGLSVLASWVVESDDVLRSCSQFMSNITIEAARLMESLPESEQNFVLEFIKKLVLAWDPDYTKLTASEAEALKEAEQSGFIDETDIDWSQIGI